jgi:hypothetical protein
VMKWIDRDQYEKTSWVGVGGLIVDISQFCTKVDVYAKFYTFIKFHHWSLLAYMKILEFLPPL